MAESVKETSVDCSYRVIAPNLPRKEQFQIVEEILCDEVLEAQRDIQQMENMFKDNFECEDISSDSLFNLDAP